MHTQDAAAHLALASPPMPGGELNLRALRQARPRIARAIEQLIALLDVIEDDADFEPDACAELSLQHEIRGGALVRAA